MSVANLYVLPLTILLIVFLIVTIVAFCVYRPLRAYRRKRNLVAYAVLIAFFCLSAYQLYGYSLGWNYVWFGIEKTQTPIYAEHQNQFGVICHSSGKREVSFYMTIRCTNATLQANSQQGYIQLNDTAIKIPFNFNGYGQETKPVYFTANANVSSISFYPFIERQKNNPFSVMSGLGEIQCTFDPITNSFAMADSTNQPYPVPA
jgi:hypothetical protein